MMDNQQWNIDDSLLHEIHMLALVCLEATATTEQRSRLQQLVCENTVVRRWYVRYMHESLMLRRLAAAELQHLDEDLIVAWPGDIGENSEEEAWASASDEESDVDTAKSGSVLSFPVSGDASLFPFLSTPIHGTPGYFSSGWPVAYLIATVLFGIGALIGAFTYVSQPVQVAERLSVGTKGHVTPESQVEFVGRITGMVGCKWADPQTEAINGDYVPFGRKYVLASGLMEITYDTGAKVVLEGPVTYEVESTAGGYLSLGKLTAKVESGKSANHHSSSTTHHPLFTINTPTATITDLGTEFSVEVDRQGSTLSHVFRGSVKIQHVGEGKKTGGEERVLYENQSAQVKRHGNKVEVVSLSDAVISSIIRELPENNDKHAIKIFDLVDVVAGGNGFLGKRNAGIDPISGRVVNSLDILAKSPWTGDGQYHRVAGLPFIDGVFVPNGGKNAVQVDSAGHVCDLFLETSNETWQYLWAGGSLAIDRVSTTINGVDYASAGHGLLYLNGNSAVTFDLEAIRQANPGYRPLRFRATAANMCNDINSYADIWVLVDGNRRYQRRQINSGSGAFLIDVPIRMEDRFLTLAATDGGDGGISHDWIIFGDPLLELLQRERETRKEP